MKCVWFVLSLVLVVFMVAPARAQSQSDQVREIRDQVQALQAKLKTLEDAETPSVTRQRTTQLGNTRIREEEPPELVVRVYDLSDLLALVAAYPGMVSSDLGPFDVPLFPSAEPSMGATGAMGMGGMGAMGGGMGGMGGFMSVQPRAKKAATPDRPAEPKPPSVPVPVYQMPYAPRPVPAGVSGGRISLDDLTSAITTTIEPQEWDEVGGRCSIASLGNTMLISATPRIHEQITKLFDVFRQRWGTLRTVSVQAHWLWLSDAQVAGLLGAEGPAKPGEHPAFGLVSDAAWESLIKELRQAADKQPAGYQAVFTCYNGQTVHAVSGGQRRIITGMTPVIDSGVVAYEPQVVTLQEGAAMQVTPMVTTGGKLVVMDVHSRVVLLHDRANRPAAELELLAGGKSAVRDVVAAIDRVQISNQHLETTIRVPVDRRMLVGGMTFEAQPKGGEPALYLFVKAKVQELRDDQTAKPEAAPAPAAKPQTPARVPPKK